MTKQEASERYQIPLHILSEYESWGLGRAAETRQYDDADLEKLSTVMTLRELGFTAPEAKAYLLLLEQPHTEGQRLRILEEKRFAALDEIHSKERQLQRLDYLRHEIRKAQGKTK